MTTRRFIVTIEEGAAGMQPTTADALKSLIEEEFRRFIVTIEEGAAGMQPTTADALKSLIEEEFSASGMFRSEYNVTVEEATDDATHPRQAHGR